MKWWPFTRKSNSNDDFEDEEAPVDPEVDDKLRHASNKLAKEREKVPDVVEAFANARRVIAKVDRFTAEIDRSFRRYNHG